MRPNYNARILVFLLTVLTAYAAGWAQDSKSGIDNSRRAGAVLHTRTAEAAVAPSSVQNVPDRSSPTAVSTPEIQQESAKASAVPMAIVPFVLEYQYASLYFRQTIDNNSDYAGISAVIQEGSQPLQQLGLVEKKGSQVVYYTNSQARADFLTASGKTAYVTPVEYKVESSLGEPPQYTIAIKDRHGKAIRWVFIPSNDPSESWPGVALLPEPLKLLYWGKATMAGEGTAVQIDNLTSPAKEEPEMSNPPWYTAYAGNVFVDAIIGGPISGTKVWQVKTAPQTIGVGAKWVLADERNNSRQLTVIAKQGNQVTIQEVEVKGSLSPPMTLYMKETPDGLSLSSLAFTDGTRALRLTFVPELDIAGLMRSGKKASVAFQLDIGDKSKVIEGVLEAERKGDLVELIGHPNSPEGAKLVTLRSKITLNGSGYRVESLNNVSADLPRTSITDK